MNSLKQLLSPAFLMLLFLCTLACSPQKPAEKHKIRIVATIFPVYDFAREIAGPHAEVSLLLPPGLEPHHFEPRPADIVRLGNADIFIFTNRFMEPWAEKLLAGAGTAKISVVEAGKGAAYSNGGDDAHEGETSGKNDSHAHGVDPHIWLDMTNAEKMVHTIAESLAARDPAHAADYRANAAAYQKKLAAMDERFRAELGTCRTRIVIHGGHYAFGYLTRRYGLTYRAAYPVSADSEPGARELAELVTYIRKNDVRFVFSEELVAPRIAQTLAQEAGASVIKLHGAHNITRDELNSGATFLSLMQQNLDNLKKGLACTTR